MTNEITNQYAAAWIEARGQVQTNVGGRRTEPPSSASNRPRPGRTRRTRRILRAR
jgi:hypothetical protein